MNENHPGNPLRQLPPVPVPDVSEECARRKARLHTFREHLAAARTGDDAAAADVSEEGETRDAHPDTP